MPSNFKSDAFYSAPSPDILYHRWDQFTDFEKDLVHAMIKTTRTDYFGRIHPVMQVVGNYEDKFEEMGYWKNEEEDEEEDEEESINQDMDILVVNGELTGPQAKIVDIINEGLDPFKSFEKICRYVDVTRKKYSNWGHNKLEEEGDEEEDDDEEDEKPPKRKREDDDEDDEDPKKMKGDGSKWEYLPDIYGGTIKSLKSLRRQ